MNFTYFFPDIDKRGTMKLVPFFHSSQHVPDPNRLGHPIFRPEITIASYKKHCGHQKHSAFFIWTSHSRIKPKIELLERHRLIQGKGIFTQSIAAIPGAISNFISSLLFSAQGRTCAKIVTSFAFCPSAPICLVTKVFPYPRVSAFKNAWTNLLLEVVGKFFRRFFFLTNRKLRQYQS